MHIQDIQYLENVDRANVINGSGLAELQLWASVGGNYGSGFGESDVLGENTFSESDARVNAWQGVGSSTSAFAIGWAIPN